MFKKLLMTSACSLFAATVMASDFTLTSKDISAGEYMPKAQEFNGFGCTGDDASPQLSWANAPEGTKSYAITAYDPDAPTGSGWWHWQLINIPADTTFLNTNAGSAQKPLAPKGSRHIENDYGVAAFGGACPPVGHGVHHYQFTVYALGVETLDLPASASGALAGYMIKANSLGSASLEALYRRD